MTNDPQAILDLALSTTEDWPPRLDDMTGADEVFFYESREAVIELATRLIESEKKE